MSKKVKRRRSTEELLEEALVPMEEQPFELPGNWSWVRFGSLIKESKLGLVRSSKEQSNDSQFPYLKMNNITIDGQLDLTGIVKVDATAEEVGQYELRERDFLFNTRNSVELVGKSTIFNERLIEGPVLFNNNILRVRFLENVIPNIINYYLNSPFGRNSLSKVKSGTTNVAAIYAKNLNTIPIPLPNMKEQERIVAKIESLFNKIGDAKLFIDEAKETFELRRAAILDKAFRGDLTLKWRDENSGVETAELLLRKIKNERQSNKNKEVQFEEIKEVPYKLPPGWVWVRLSEILNVNPPKEKIEGPDNQICSFVPMASVSDVTGEIVKIEEREFSEVRKGYTLFKNNDVIFAKITPCMENGKSAIVKDMKNGFGYGSTEFFVLRTSQFINAKLIHYLVRSSKFRHEAKGVMTGAVGQQRVPKSFIEEYIFPLPPKLEQDKIVSLLDSLLTKEEEAAKITSLEESLDTLKQSILLKAFRGELGTNDPSKEIAIDLLKDVFQGQMT